MRVIKMLFLTIPSLAATFAEKELFLTLYFILQFWYFAITRKTIFRGKEMAFALHSEGRRIVFYPTSIVDLAVLEEVFVKREYAWEPNMEPRTIIDLGAHFGDTTLYYHLRYPNAKIIAVEPSPATFKRLQRHVEGITNIVALQAAVGGHDGTVDLYVEDSSISSSLVKRKDTAVAVSVPLYTLRSLLSKYAIDKADLIKFDIEGAEEFLFTTEEPHELARAYIGEIHGDIIKTSVDDLLSKFSHFNIEKESVSNPKRFIMYGNETF
jgi:FkbM family methyltransferase